MVDDSGQKGKGERLLSAEKVRAWIEKHYSHADFVFRDVFEALDSGEFDAEPLAALVRARRKRDETVAQLTELREAVQFAVNAVGSDCEMVIDKMWSDQRYCSTHAVWFRRSMSDALCPVGAVVAMISRQKGGE